MRAAVERLDLIDVRLDLTKRPAPQASIEELEYEAIEEAAEEALSTTMPNRHLTSTPIEKFTKYSLDPSNPRAAGKPEAYRRGLGYTRDNAQELADNIHRAVSTGEVKPYRVKQDEFGVKYEFRIPVTGPNGKTKNVIAVYMIDKGGRAPRMITNYLEGR